ncbi:type II secretion system minor pseudopilin GspH [Shewanella chilikensis]|uniref:type II secretion system minor pseudopilin GspH n=1 Tax=Shewanella chilikensis TaxID=558541 RepID=UPI001F3E7E22|nr:type II secretion system minor pseudopilin GspH [Shewanella chilikensis]MCE9786077.1 type II secretion system minor pseudopilin GspH [Shewanella chilikensis]
MQIRRSLGFTLLEVMLVVLLMGLAATAVTMTMGDSGPKQQLTREAQRFMAATETVLDETVLSGQFIGIVVDKNKYHFVLFKENKWQPLEQDRLLAEKQLPEGITLSVELEGLPLVQEDEEQDSWFDEPFIEESDADKKKFPEPQIMLLPSGEMTAFELSFIAGDSLGETVDVLVSGDSLGRLKLGRFDDFE